MLEQIQKQAIGRFFFYILNVVAGLVLLLGITRVFIVSPGVVNGPSMEPNYKDDKVFLVNRFIYLLQIPKRQEVVQIIEPKQKKLIIKRIIGLPGDTVMIKRGKVFVQELGAKEYELDEHLYLDSSSYTEVPSGSDVRTFTLKPNEFFVLGDNRRASVDSRYYGPVPRSHIIGKVIN